MISLHNIASQIYNESLSAKEERVLIDSIWIKNQIMLKEFFGCKINFIYAVIKEKLRVEDEEAFYQGMYEVEKYKYSIFLSNHYRDKYLKIEEVLLTFKNIAIKRANRKVRCKMRSLVSLCGQKKRSKEFHYAVKIILEKHNMVIFSKSHSIKDLSMIEMDHWITIIAF